MSNSACLKGGAILFLTTLTRGAVAHRLVAVLEPADRRTSEAHGGIELQSLPASGGLRVAEEHADLLAQLVDEDGGGAGGGQGPGDLAQRLAHETRLEADMGVAHLPLDLGLGDQGRHGVDDDDVQAA